MPRNRGFEIVVQERQDRIGHRLQLAIVRGMAGIEFALRLRGTHIARRGAECRPAAGSPVAPGRCVGTARNIGIPNQWRRSVRENALQPSYD